MVKQITPGSQRVPGLPIKDCAESCNSSVQRCTSSNSIDVTAKTFFESFYLVPGLSSFEHSDQVNCPCAPTFPPLTLHLFLDFCAIFFPEWPLDFFVITTHQVIWPSPGTLGSWQEKTLPAEGTGTWPDYLVNRDDQKNEGLFGEKTCTKIEK